LRSSTKIPKNQSRNIVLGYQVTQHNRDTLLIEKLITFFNCGRLELSKSAINFVVTRLSDITGIIIPFLASAASRKILYYRI